MDQTHTLTAGATWRHAATGAWAGTSVEYGSGTPVGHGAAHEHGEGASDHEDPSVEEGAQRVPGHFTGNLSAGIDLIRDSRGRGRLTLRLDVENVADDVYVVAQEGVFSPAQYSIPRIVAVTARIRF
jgi:outer membrane receptor protein involved in Fe transport